MKFRGVFNLALAVSLLVAAVPAALAAEPAKSAAADPYEATVTRVVKLVEWQRYRTKKWQRAVEDNLLMVGDTLRTGPEAKAELTYGDGSVTRVGSLTALTLTGDKKRELRLDSGKVWLHIQKGGAGMRIITPGAVAAVTGTELLVEFDPVKKLTEVTVFEGSVNVTGDVGNLVRVLGGTTTRVPFRAPAAAPVPLDNRKLQERNSIFRPLSAPETPASPETAQPEAKQPETKQPETKEPEAKNPESKDPEGKQPETKEPEVKTPEVKASTTPETPVAKEPAVKPETPKTPETAPSPTVEPDKKAVSPDLKGQNQLLNDPRLINGSPTTGRVKVIIE